MDFKEYLNRIKIDGSKLAADLESLKLLHRKHLLNVPFENLDIHRNRPILLDKARFFEKIVGGRRGGFCYELNGLFESLLKAVGFQTRLVSARVFMPGGGFSAEYAHAAIIVTIGESEYLADVGFGDFVFEPLVIIPDVEQKDREGGFFIHRDDNGYLVSKMNGGTWIPEYKFDPIGRTLFEFTDMCDFHQTSSESTFTKNIVCTIMTNGGRKTLSSNKYIVTDNGEKTEIEVGSEEGFDMILAREFGIRQID